MRHDDADPSLDELARRASEGDREALTSAATGTVMRPETLKRYAAEAGFTGVEILDQVQHDFLRFYRVIP